MGRLARFIYFFTDEDAKDDNGGLPSEFKKLDYVTFNGNAYLNTGKSVAGTKSYETKWRLTGSYSVYLYGYNNTTNKTSTTAYLTESGNWRFGPATVLIGTQKDVWHNTLQDKTGVVFDGVEHKYSNVGTFSSTYNIYLGCGRSKDGERTNYFEGDVASFKIRDNGVLVRDYVPAKKLSTGVYGFYDRVSGNFYISDGDPFTGSDMVSDKVGEGVADYMTLTQ